MRLSGSTKQLVIIFFVLLLAAAGFYFYQHLQRSSEEQRVADMMNKISEVERKTLEESNKANQSIVRGDGTRTVKKGEDGLEIVTITYSNGTPREEYEMKDDKLEGTFKLWDTQGRLIEETEYKNNLPSGIQKSFYGNGILKSETIYVDGIKAGLSKNWYQNGKESSEVEYKNDVVISSVSFYPNGEVRTKEILNEVTGLLTMEAFYSNGQLSHTYGTIHGKREGTLIKNAPTGFKVAEAEYKNGVNDGWCRIWNEANALDVELFYVNGQLDRSKKAIGKSCDIDVWRFGFR